MYFYSQYMILPIPNDTLVIISIYTFGYIYVSNNKKNIFIYLSCPIGSYFDRRKEEETSVLFNDALNTFYLRLYGVGHTVKDH